MRKTLFSSLVLSFILAMSAPIFAADANTGAWNIWGQPKQNTPNQPKFNRARQAELARKKAMAEYYKKDAAFRKEARAKKAPFVKQINELRAKKDASKNDAEKTNLDAQILTAQKQLHALNIESAKHDVAVSKFTLKQVQDKLEGDIRRLAQLQARKFDALKK